jgi:murein DD-endopeptidase MepM/ murein hydrolase activator NlpD
MLHAREDWANERECAEVLAFPAQLGAKGEFGRRPGKQGFRLVVDLHAEEIGLKWFRGAATLAALCSAAIFLTPDWHPKVATPAAPPAATLKYAQLSELATPHPAVVDDAATGLPKPVGVQSGASGNVKRIRGDIAGGLYFSLRAAGATPQIASDYLKAIATHIDVGDVAPYDRFDFAFVKGGAGQPDKLIYAALDRFQYSDVQLLKWSAGGRTDWFDGSTSPQASSGLMAPVAGRITSGFGYRVHPILRYARFHAGIDFGAPWGSPIVAAADGQVVGAGYAGGYGRQVRIVHSGGLMTSYSHMSSIVAQPGLPVRQGQVIGYVGSSGLSTGPHVHFEVRVGGRPVNPLTARLVSRPVFDGPQLATFKARLKEILAIPMKAQGAATAEAGA